MIRNICEYIGRFHESYLFIGRFKVPEIKIEHIRIVDTNIYPDIQDNSCNPEDKHIKTMTKAFEAVVDKIKPDIVNFHGIGRLMQKCIEICINKKIPYVYTDHLFIGSANIQGYEKNAKWEKEVYNIPDLKVIAVSTGMKTKILQNYPNVVSDNITVIKNGTDFIAEWQDSNLIKKYNLENKKVLLCVGTINYRKNQCQVVRAYQLLPFSIQSKIKVIFCGKDSVNGILQECIAASGLQDKLMYVGAISSEDMKKYYSISDGLIMPSYAEGLSIAALEAIAYGLPVIMYADSECAEDLFDEKVVCFAKERTDYNLSEAMKDWYEKVWDREYIINYSKYFTMERVAEDYISYYKACIKCL